jgi:predicted TIM-barrel fold metal-dependent hydrolase
MTPVSGPYEPGAVDCDVHCAPVSYADLAPYLSDYWRQYISEGAVRLTGVAHAYPPNAPVTASAQAREKGWAAAPATYEQLAERYLEAAAPQTAVLTCVTGFDNHRNPYFSAAVASAINDWLRDEFLARDERLTLLWRFDKDWKGVWREVPWVKEPPSEYVRRHFRATTAPAHLPDDPAAADQLLEMLGGAGMLAYASDFPHEHGDGLSTLLGQHDDDGREGVLRQSAAALYGL